MNWRLTLYPKLYHTVFLHEIGHDDGKYKFKDFTHDMKSRTPGLFGFMRRHISSWLQVLPFYYDIRKNKLVYDISTIVSWGFAIAISIVIFFFLRWIL